ncbi:ATP-binding protein [Streptomyces sp. H10-C2]|uniref:ATP-binding protein n=1 Tax=unclassified Streptomyces TaxID=2593676 RepID=UPI0024BBE555|nr:MULTISPECIES: ATP-binding protein [unclassified Streptomyces]MDJ0345903.1 ATP-binding protein [Streptomyces sp. PH10-H1]MDJ0374752.1 ATP-binding protein [Streptomyces sp. H10-C2]
MKRNAKETSAGSPQRRGPLARLLTTTRAEPDAAYRSGLNLTHVIGNLTVARTGHVTAWYVCAPQRWSFRTDDDRNRVLTDHALRLSELSGRRVHLRITHRPYPIAQWAQSLHGEAIAPIAGWDRYLEEEQRKVARLPLDLKTVYYGVRIGRVSGLGRTASKLGGSALTRALAALRQDIAELDRTMDAPGMEAAPATPAEMDWLLARSLGLGLPAPVALPRPSGVWHEQDVAEWTDGISWSSPEPYTPHIEVRGLRAGREVERCVSVCSFGQMELPPIPESGYGPWLQRLDRLGFPCEVSVTFDVRAGDEVGKEILDQLSRIRAQEKHHREHDVDLPLSLVRQRDIGVAIEDDNRSNFAGGATRVQAWVRVAVAGRDAEEVRDRVDALQKLYKGAITVVRPADQYKLAREFIPEEPLSTDAHKRRMPVTTMAGALPAASAEVGDRVGPNLGFTSGITRRAVMWHPWHNQEVREGSGLTPVVSTLGGGKTVLCGSIVYNTLRMGAPWVVLDPSGPVTRMCDLPELKPYSKAINLINAEPGTLNPFRIIPDPLPEHYQPQHADYINEDDPVKAAESAYHRAVTNARAQRKALAVDVMSGLLRAQITNSEATQRALMLAASRVDATVNASPRDILAALRKLDGAEMSEHGQHLAQLLEEAAELPQGQLIFPGVDGGDDRYKTEHLRLVVMSLRGLTLPTEGTNPNEWSLEEQYSMPLLYLAGWYAQRSIYDRPMGDRKGLWLDECHEMLRVSSGRTLLRKTGRDSRKHNVRALYATQDGGDILTADIANWIDSVFIGRTVGDDAQRAALKLVNIEPGNGYEKVLAGLSPRARGNKERRGNREFIFSDGDGGIERITVTLDHRPSLKTALDSTANPRARQEHNGHNPYTDDGVLDLLKGGTR